jgi:O-antigen/teichoic acid export membrane protein
MAAVLTRITGKRAAARNFSWLMADKLLAVALGLFVFGLIARHYGPAASGQLAFGLALLQTALGLSLVCSAAAILPRLSRQPYAVRGPIANIFVVRLAGSVFAALATGIYAALTVADPGRLAITLILLASVPLLEPFYTAVVFWQSRNDNRLPTLVRGAGLITRTAVVLLAVTLGAPIELVAAAWLLEAAVSAALQMRSLRSVIDVAQMKQRVRMSRVRPYFLFGVRFLLGLALANLFSRLDRLVLAERMSAHDFGLYAAAMQLVDVWVQVAYVLGFAIGPAFLYRDLAAKRRPAVSFLREIAALSMIGMAGLALAWLLGRLALQIVFGTQFVVAAPVLVAGMAFAVLMYADQVVQLAVTASNRPGTLALKWGSACMTAALVQVLLFERLGAYAGPLGLGLGVVAGWVATGVSIGLQHRQGELADAGCGSRT